MNAVFKFINRLFFRGKELDNIEKFRARVKLSLKELEGNSPDSSDYDLLHALQAKGIPKQTAKLIIENLSTSFCRKLLDEIKWKPNDPNYPLKLRSDEAKALSVEKKLVMEEETEAYFLNNPNSRLIVSLASRCIGPIKEIEG